MSKISRRKMWEEGEDVLPTIPIKIIFCKRSWQQMAASVPGRQPTGRRSLFIVHYIRCCELVTVIAQWLTLAVDGGPASLVHRDDHRLARVDGLAGIWEASNFVFLHLMSQLAYFACRRFENLQHIGTHL